MRITIINGEQHIVEEYKETGDLLRLRRVAPIANRKAFLLTGDSHEGKDYYLPLQVFSYLKKKGFDFLLFILVHDRLKDQLARHADSLELSDRSYVIEDCTKGDESRYGEIIDMVKLFNTGLVLRKSGKVIERAFSALAENLESSLEEERDEC